MITHRIPIGSYHLIAQEQGTGPALLFCHSLTFDSSMFDAQAQALAEHFRVIRLDLHGHGQSSHPLEDFELEQMAEDLCKVLDHLQIDRCGYVGHSMGGMVGMRFALAHPDRVAALALLNTSANEQEQPLRDIFHQVNEDSRGKPTNPATVDFVLGLMFSEGFITAQPSTVAPFRQMLAEPPEGDGIYFAAKAVIWRSSVLDQLAQIDIPTLVLTSDIDTSVPASHSRDIAQAVPGARLIELTGSGHLTPVERSAEVIDVLTDHFTLQGGHA
jgi:3-oxoadipate enol-lactonase